MGEVIGMLAFIAIVVLIIQERKDAKTLSEDDEDPSDIF